MALLGAATKTVTHSHRAGSISARQLAAASVHLALQLRKGNLEALPIPAVAALPFVAASLVLPRLFRRHYASVPLLP